MTAEQSQSWLDRQARAMVETFGGEEDDFRLPLEAYAEIKTAELKIALSRCYEILFSLKRHGSEPDCEQSDPETSEVASDDFLDDILKLIGSTAE